MNARPFVSFAFVVTLMLGALSLNAAGAEIEHRTDSALRAPEGNSAVTEAEVLRPHAEKEPSHGVGSSTLEASLSSDPGSVVILVATSLPEPSLKALGAQAAQLHIALAFSSLPLYARSADELRAIESPLEARARTPKDSAEMLPAGPFKVDNTALRALGDLLNPTGVLAGTSPEVWHAVRDALPEEPPVPALVLFGHQAIEVFPGDLPPVEMLAIAAERAQYQEIRALAQARLRAERAQVRSTAR